MYFPRLWALASHRRAHTPSSTQMVQHLIHALDAQALPWELGSEDGHSGLSLASSPGRSSCMRAAGLHCSLFILVLTQRGILDTFLLLDDNCRYLISLFHSPSWERYQLLRTAGGARCWMGPLLPWPSPVWAHECLPSVQLLSSPTPPHVTASFLLPLPVFLHSEHCSWDVICIL